MAKIAICIPTYARQSALENLCSTIVLPIYNRYGTDVDIFIRDNSIGVDAYDFSLVESLFTFADYKLNSSNLLYHGNVLALYDLCKEGSYVWILPDDDSYSLTSIFEIIDGILADHLNADVILPPFSYARNPSFISTQSILSLFSYSSLQQSNLKRSHLTTFDKLLSHNLYPYIPLTSSFIFRKRTSPHASEVIFTNLSNAWLHEVLMLSTVDRYSTIQIARCSPYVYYQEFFDTNNKPLKSGMSIEYFHYNNIALNRLRSTIFNDQALFDLRRCWRESLLWLIQDKDQSISWTNNTIYSHKLALRAIIISIRYLDLWLFTLCLSFLLVPARVIKLVRTYRGRHRAFTPS